MHSVRLVLTLDHLVFAPYNRPDGLTVRASQSILRLNPRQVVRILIHGEDPFSRFFG